MRWILKEKLNDAEVEQRKLQNLYKLAGEEREIPSRKISEEGNLLLL